MSSTPTPSERAIWWGRASLILAAILWSLSSLFTRLLQTPTILNLHEPALTPLQIAFFRALFAGLFFLPMLRRRDLTFQPLMPWMVVTFAVMNGLFLSAMALGSAANAIFLQNTAPLWVYLIGVYLMGESSTRADLRVMQWGLLGLCVIVGGSWMTGPVDQLPVVAMAAASGVTYAIILVCLRQLRGESSAWLTTLNHLGAALALSVFIIGLPGPSWRQVGFLAIFGVLQMGLPYWLMANGLRTVRAQEACLITLLEPMLNPVWAYLIDPERETPPMTTWLGGAIILGALLWRYWPRRGEKV